MLDDNVDDAKEVRSPPSPHRGEVEVVGRFEGISGIQATNLWGLLTLNSPEASEQKSWHQGVHSTGTTAG